MHKEQVKQLEHEVQWLEKEINTKKLTRKNIAEYQRQIRQTELTIAFNSSNHN